MDFFLNTYFKYIVPWQFFVYIFRQCSGKILLISSSAIGHFLHTTNSAMGKILHISSRLMGKISHIYSMCHGKKLYFE